MKIKMPLIVVLLTFLMFQTKLNAQDIATTLCESYVPAVGQIASSMRSAGAPISMAENQIYSMNINDSRMRIFLKGLVGEMYREPEKTTKLIQSGDVVKRCVAATRGY